MFMGDVDASEALNLHQTDIVKGERGLCHGPRFLRIRVIGRRKSHREMDGSHQSRNFPYKYRCISLLFLTFDRFVNQLSEFEGRS